MNSSCLLPLTTQQSNKQFYHQWHCPSQEERCNGWTDRARLCHLQLCGDKQPRTAKTNQSGLSDFIPCKQERFFINCNCLCLLELLSANWNWLQISGLSIDIPLPSNCMSIKIFLNKTMWICKTLGLHMLLDTSAPYIMMSWKNSMVVHIGTTSCTTFSSSDLKLCAFWSNLKPQICKICRITDRKFSRRAWYTLSSSFDKWKRGVEDLHVGESQNFSAFQK